MVAFFARPRDTAIFGQRTKLDWSTPDISQIIRLFSASEKSRTPTSKFLHSESTRTDWLGSNWAPPPKVGSGWVAATCSDGSVRPPHRQRVGRCRQHCRLSICENWLSWTNTVSVSEQKIPITILILKRGPCLEKHSKGKYRQIDFLSGAGYPNR